MNFSTIKTYMVGGMLSMTCLTLPALAPEAQAQTQQVRQIRLVKGRVNDAMGPMVGATVVEKGSTSNGVVTDVDGNFSSKRCRPRNNRWK